jgi:hypothetical protein
MQGEARVIRTVSRIFFISPPGSGRGYFFSIAYEGLDRD